LQILSQRSPVECFAIGSGGPDEQTFFYAPIDWKVRNESWNRSDDKASSCAACGWHGVGGGEHSEGSVQKR
jgi:hypothetical protein